MDKQETPELTPSNTLAGENPLPSAADLAPLEPSASLIETPGLDGSAEGSSPLEGRPDEGEGEAAPTGEPTPSELPPSAPPPRDTRLTRLLIGIAVAAVVLLVGAAFLWKAHSDLGALRQEVEVLKAQSQRAQVVQQRGAILRVRAELQTLRQTLPPELSLDVDKAEALLVGVDERLKASR